MGWGGHSTDLLERADELDRIERLLDSAAAGEGRALLIEGQAGIGKTALLEAARRRAQAKGMTVLPARGGELEGHFPFGVVRQLFEPVLRGTSPEARAELLSGAAQLAVPALAGSEDDSPASADPAFGLLHGLYWLTLNLASQRPVLIAVDDAQWADARSLRFLLYLVGRLEGVAVAVLAAARPGEQALDPDFAARLVRERLLEVIAPEALSQCAVGELLGAGLGQAPDPEFVAACELTTGGVPFLVHELVAALAADRVQPTARQATGVQELGPRAVARATLVRLARMPAGCLPLARSLAVLGSDALLRRAARLADLDEQAALEALDALVAAGVVRTNGRLEFVHPILRAAIYDELPPGERSRLHRRAARLLAGEGAQLDAVAAQLLASEPTGSQEVIAKLREAAASALARGAPEDAIAYLERASHEGCERELRAAITFELGMAARVAGRAAMVEHFEEAHRLAEDPVLRASAAFELATALGLKGEWTTSPMALIQGALEDLGDRDPDLATRLECYRAAIAGGQPRLIADLDRRLPALHELVARGGDAARPLALLLAVLTAWRDLDSRKAVVLVQRGWDDGRILGPATDLWSLGRGFEALVISGELERARELTDTLLVDARERGSMSRFVVASAYRGWIDAARGSLLPAEDALRTALRTVREHHARYAVCSYLWFATDVIVERPECADLGALAETVELGPIAGTLTGAWLLDVRGRIRNVAGKTAAAIDDLRSAGEIFEALGLRNPNATNRRSALALMLPPAERDEAHRLATEELEDARRAGPARGIGVALRALGVLEGDRQKLEQAVTTLESSPARLEYARALVEFGAHLRRAGERAACREPLRKALDLAIECGATRLSDRARAELESSGAHPRRERITGRDALTPSELRVALLAAEGRTNNEVAQALFVTPKTVDTHLSHVYSKLGISSRRALAAALEAQAGADPDQVAVTT